ncbi:hypothetical protein [Streptomyces sp. NRRL S-350]|uniref:hypothetical protein n=1 Tax=Streptomyces sp. NRRL S-350 TaxID=1463902 RepID=UPI000691F92B|nr:hypothetical protein [Streptomyces sp. NRRL S-350]
MSGTSEPTAPPDEASSAPEAAAPQVGPLGVEPVPTGHPAVDAGLARLEALDGVPAEAHVAVYEDVHQRLADALAALDQE